MIAWEWDSGRLWGVRARLVRVLDGDSLIALCDCGFAVRYEARIRIGDLWTPETGDPGGAEATAELVSALGMGTTDWPLRVVTRQRETIVSEVRSFERWVADVFVRLGDGTLSDVRVLLGMGYDGTGRVVG